MPRGNKPVLRVEPGDQFGQGTVVTLIRITTPGNGTHASRRGALLRCHASCGAVYSAELVKLVQGKITSCGCKGQSAGEQMLRRQIRALTSTAGYEISGFTLTRRASQ